MSSRPTDRPDDDQAAEAEAAGGASAVDGWLDAEIANVWVAAYHAGRLLNQLRWHAHQHCLLNDRHHRDLVVKAFDRLIAIASQITLSLDSPLAEQLKVSLKRYHEYTTSEHAADAWHACNDAITRDRKEAEEAVANSWDPEGVRSVLRENREYELERLAKSWAGPTVETLRQALLDVLPGEKELAFTLGWLVDQSVRRPDVYLFMWKEPEWTLDSSGAPNVNSESNCSNLIANHGVEAGSLPPERGWSELILQSVQKLAGPGATTVKPPPRVEKAVSRIAKLPVRPRRHECLSAVEDLDGALRDYFSNIWWFSPDEPPPTQYPYGPLTGQKKQLAKWILPGEADERTLAGRVGVIVWIRRVGRYEFEAWFKSKERFDLAKEKKSESDTSGSSEA